LAQWPKPKRETQRVFQWFIANELPYALSGNASLWYFVAGRILDPLKF
jgi:hypothetical protein